MRDMWQKCYRLYITLIIAIIIISIIWTFRLQIITNHPSLLWRHQLIGSLSQGASKVWILLRGPAKVCHPWVLLSPDPPCWLWVCLPLKIRQIEAVWEWMFRWVITTQSNQKFIRLKKIMEQVGPFLLQHDKVFRHRPRWGLCLARPWMCAC